MRDLDLEFILEQRLEIFARWGDFATFRNLATAAGKNQLDRRSYRIIAKALRDLDWDRFERGLPLLSPIVRRSRTARPPAGIASLLRRLALLADHDVLEEVVEEERQRTWRHYCPAAKADERIARDLEVVPMAAAS
jgi:hypothetical protein